MSEAREGLIARIMRASARQPILTLLFVLLGLLGGAWSVRYTPLDALPDLSDPQVVVLTEWPGQSPDQVEDQVTYPLSTALLGTPGVQWVRGQSFFGLSFVYVIFEEGVDPYWGRSRVLEELSTVRTRLPPGVEPELGPDATGVGWVFQYALVDETGTRDLGDLRALQDYNIRYALESLPGVAEVATVGGVEREARVEVDPRELESLGIPLSQVVSRIQAANADSGGGLVELAGHEHMIRGLGRIEDLDDLASVPVGRTLEGTPVQLGQVARIGEAPAPRRGMAELDGLGEVVGGIVVMRQGENALSVIEDVRSRLESIQTGLPEGVKVEVVYDRSELIRASIDTLTWTLAEEMLVVSLVIGLFLLHLRSALVVILTLPVAVLLAFVPMVGQGLTANVMSLGGIAVAIGALVDASIVIVENVHRRLGEWDEQGSPGSRQEVLLRAMTEVGPSIFFSLLVITVSFLPVFTLQGTEGRLFRPLGYTKTWAMACGALLAITLTPALVVLLLRGTVVPESQHPVSRRVIGMYAPVVRWVVGRRRAVMAAAAGLFVITMPLAASLESEFMPPLREGSLLYMPSSPPGMSLTEAGNVLQVTDRLIAEVPEVYRVFGKIGRAETATDPAPLSMAETTILLRPKSEWRPGMTWEKLVAELDETVQVPGMPNLWWMPIQTRIEMLATGVRSPLAVQIYGDDLPTIERTALALEDVLGGIEGTRSVFAERATGGFYLDVELDRDRAARHGVQAADVRTVLGSALGGVPVTEIYRGRERMDVAVRYGRADRDEAEDVGRALVQGHDGMSVPLSAVAEVLHRTGPPMIRSEDGRLTGFVFVDPGERAIGDWVAEARAAVAAGVSLPPGVRIEWVGQYRHFERAQARMIWVLPATLLLVFLLLYINTRSLPETLMVLLAVPFSLIGAVWLVWLLDFHMSVAVWVGLIALAGLDAETGVIMLLYLRLSWERWQREGRMDSEAALTEAIVEGAAHRIRPKLMTVLTLVVGLTPLLWSDGAGADVMKRIAAPMVGGLFTSFLLELTVYPAVFAWWKSRGLRAR